MITNKQFQLINPINCSIHNLTKYYINEDIDKKYNYIDRKFQKKCNKKILKKLNKMNNLLRDITYLDTQKRTRRK